MYVFELSSRICCLLLDPEKGEASKPGKVGYRNTNPDICLEIPGLTSQLMEELPQASTVAL